MHVREIVQLGGPVRRVRIHFGMAIRGRICSDNDEDQRLMVKI
jgi:class 3 adenylate cyclase